MLSKLDEMVHKSSDVHFEELREKLVRLVDKFEFSYCNRMGEERQLLEFFGDNTVFDNNYIYFIVADPEYGTQNSLQV